MYSTGKSWRENMVLIYPRHRKFEFILMFANKEEAGKYYEALDYEKEKFRKLRLKAFFCRHEETERLDFVSDRYHYDYCPKCNRAIYVNDETEEQAAERKKRTARRFKEGDILNLKEQNADYEEKIKENNKKIARLQKELDSEDELEKKELTQEDFHSIF